MEKSDPHDEKAQTDSDGAPQCTARIAIFEATDAQRPVANAWFERQGRTWQVRLQARDELVAERVRASLEAAAVHSTCDDAAADEVHPSQWPAIFENLEERGFKAKELPIHDHTIQLELDMHRGRAVASYDTTNVYATRDEVLAKDLTEKLTAALKESAVELANEVADAARTGDHERAAQIVREARNEGRFSLPLCDELLNALRAIDCASLSPEDRRTVLRCLASTADMLQRYDVARDAAEALLSDADAALDASERAAYEMVSALGAIKAGRSETGLLRLRRLSRRDGLDATTRAWIWRNISLALPPENPEARAAARHSADAFLEAGNKKEAAKSLKRAIDCTRNQEPSAALETFDEILTLMTGKGVGDRALRATVLHSSAQMLAQMARHAAAFERAREAAELQENLVGWEERRVASLYLAAIEARAAGLIEAAEAAEREAKHLADQLRTPHYKLAARLIDLFTNFSATAAESLVRDAKKVHHDDVVTGVAIVRGLLDDTLTDERNLELLEEQLAGSDQTSIAAKLMGPPVLLALALLLERMGEHDRAEVWFRQAHDANPLDTATLSYLINNLWKREKWGDAAVLIKKHLARYGELPGLMYAYSRSLFEAGSITEAIPALARAWELLEARPDLRKIVMNLRERALSIPVLPQIVTSGASTVVTLDEIGAALREFAIFVSAEKRMRFWTTSTGRVHTWREFPERYGQDLLHTYLQARFGDRVHVLEEVTAGAGRIDVLVQVRGGLTFVIELKMCGATYSSAYAAAGEEQLQHYMANRKTSIGYLLVFDGRMRDFAKPLLVQSDPAATIDEIFVDVRPTVRRNTDNAV